VRYSARVKPGTIIDDLALSIDLAPTLLDVTSLRAEQAMDGRSLVPLLVGQTPRDWRTSFLIEYYSDTALPIHTWGTVRGLATTALHALMPVARSPGALSDRFPVLIEITDTC
jgi:hypothetical protein